MLHFAFVSGFPRKQFQTKDSVISVAMKIGHEKSIAPVGISLTPRQYRLWNSRPLLAQANPTR
jgi:hypothetical protein